MALFTLRILPSGLVREIPTGEFSKRVRTWGLCRGQGLGTFFEQPLQIIVGARVVDRDRHLGRQKLQQVNALLGKHTVSQVVLQIENGAGLPLVDQRRTQERSGLARLNIRILDERAGLRRFLEHHCFLSTGHVADDTRRQQVGFCDVPGFPDVCFRVVHGSFRDDSPLPLLRQDQEALLCPGVLDDMGHQFAQQLFQLDFAGNVLGCLENREQVQVARQLARDGPGGARFADLDGAADQPVRVVFRQMLCLPRSTPFDVQAVRFAHEEAGEAIVAAIPPKARV
jgi:hypothetical protein